VIGISAGGNFVILECTFYKIYRHHPRKAGDPVNAGVSILINVAEYWMPRFRGA
jgi:hypothetical protein